MRGTFRTIDETAVSSEKRSLATLVLSMAKDALDYKQYVAVQWLTPDSNGAVEAQNGSAATMNAIAVSSSLRHEAIAEAVATELKRIELAGKHGTLTPELEEQAADFGRRYSNVGSQFTRTISVTGSNRSFYE